MKDFEENSLVKEVQYTGKWWLPDNQDKKIPGRLRFKQSEGAILELDGCFAESPKITESFNLAIVNGSSNTGEDITLHRCLGRVVNVTGSFVEPRFYYISKVYAREVFVGVHFQTEEEIKFSHLRIHYSHLDEWLNMSGFRFEDHGDEKVLRHKPPGQVQISVSNELRLLIAFQCSYTPYSVTEPHITQRAVIVIIPAKEMHFEKHQQMVRSVQDFLSLAVGEAIYPLDIEGETESAKQVIANHTVYEDVKIFYQLPIVPKERGLGTFEPLFSYKAIAGKFEQLIKNWFGKAEQLAPVYDLYFASVYGHEMYLEQKFLCLIQALESYHRRMVKNRELPQKDHNKRIKEIMGEVPPEYQEWLRKKLEHSNEPTLRRRLNGLLDNKFPETTSSLIKGGKKGKKAFVDKVCKTRNYLIHYEPKLKGAAAKEETLYRITLQLTALVEMCLLKELGFTLDEVHNCVSTKYSRYKILREST